MKNRFLNDMQARIEVLEEKLKELAGLVESKDLDGQERQHFQIKMKAVAERKNALEARLDEARAASGSAWEAIREEAEVVYADLVTYMDEVYSHYGSETGLF